MTYTKEVSNPFKYRAHYNTTIRAIYTPLGCHVHIEQPTGGIITVVYNGKNYTTDFTVPKGKTIIVKTQINDAYLSNQLSINGEKITPNTKYVVNSDINITLDLSLQSFLVKAKALRTCGLVINYNDQDTVLEAADENQTSFYVAYGESIVITAKPIESYKVNGILIYEDGNSQPIKYNNNAVEYVVKKKISIELDCEIKKFWVEIDQPIETQNDSKTTWVIRNGDQIYDGFYANWGETLQIHAEPSAMTDHLGDTPNIKYDLSYISVVNEDDHTKENYNSGATITVKSNISINPIYKIHNCNIRITKNDKAIISAKVGETNYTDVDFIVPYGTNVSFTVTVKDTENYYFNDLTINGKSITQNINQRVTEDLIVNADIREVIKVNYFTIKINQPENAKIYVEYNNKTYTETFPAAEGSICTAYVTPNDGYKIMQFRANETSLPVNERYQFTVDKEYIFSATAQILTGFAINFNQVEGGTLQIIHNNETKTSSFTCTYGDTIKVIQTANNGYTAGTIYDNGNAIENNATITVKEDHTITTSFEIQVLRIDVQQPENGRITINGSYGTSFRFPYNTEITVQCTPTEGYELGNIYSNGVIIQNNSKITVTKSLFIKADISKMIMELILDSVENGYWKVNDTTITAGVYKYPYGTHLKVECFANDGYIKPTELIMETTE